MDVEPDIESLSPPPLNRSRKTSLLREFCKRALHWVWDSFGLSTLKEDLDSHDGTIKRARVLWFTSVMVVLGGCGGYWINGLRLGSQVDEAKGENASNSVAIRIVQANYDTAKDALQQLNFNLVRVEAERNSLKEKLAPFELRAAQLYTNDLPTEQLNRLYKDIQADDFEVWINGATLRGMDTNNVQEIELPTGRFEISVKNTGRFPLRNTTVLCSGRWMLPGSVDAVGWIQNGAVTVVDRFGEALLSNWRVIADAPYGRSMRFITPPIILKTNVADWQRTNSIPLYTFLRVFSDHSDIKEFLFILKLPPKD